LASSCARLTGTTSTPTLNDQWSFPRILRHEVAHFVLARAQDHDSVNELICVIDCIMYIIHIHE
jgi:hypothetical protein